MDHVTSADGTSIAVHETGAGDAVVIVNGAFSTARDGTDLANALAGRALRAITYDRRARAGSGDTAPYSPQREAEDLAAVISHAGGEVAVLGHSSGAVLALYAAGRRVAMRHLFLSEPPFRFGVDEPDPALPDRLQSLIDDGHPDEAVTVFQREGVGLPEEMIAQIRQSPLFSALVGLAQSTVYDATLTQAVSTPTPEMLGVSAPVTILCGAQTFPLLSAAAQRLKDSMPDAELAIVPESVMHRPDPEATARIVADRLSGPLSGDAA